MPVDKQLVTLLVGAVGAWVIKFGWDAGSSWLDRRGKRKVDVARRAVEKAKLTPDEQDDLIAEMALKRAEDDAEFASWLAEQMQKHKPPMPGAE